VYSKYRYTGQIMSGRTQIDMIRDDSYYDESHTLASVDFHT